MRSFPASRTRASGPTIPRSPRRAPILTLRNTGDRPAILALSGGGADGAFGAGLLNGWTQRGDRPQFAIVTGASAGALIAPFAFLGSALRRRARQCVFQRRLRGLPAIRRHQRIVRSRPVRDRAAARPDRQACDPGGARRDRASNIATAASSSSSPPISTRSAARSGTWAAIASSPDPAAPELFRRVIEASASIPGVFAPVLIDVEAQGKRFAEMHVDGGIISNVLVVPEALHDRQPADPAERRSPAHLCDYQRQARALFRSGASRPRSGSRCARSRRRCAPTPATRCSRPMNSSAAATGSSRSRRSTTTSRRRQSPASTPPI